MVRILFGSSAHARSALELALRDCRRAFWSVALFSGAVNLLMLAGPLYMLQVYDRVLTSGSVPTLIGLSVFLVGAYVFQAVLDIVRGRLVARVARLLDQQMEQTVHAAEIAFSILPGEAAERPVDSLDQIRTFLSSRGPIAIVDLPWVPVFLTICYLIHPWLGALSLLGAIVLFVLALLTERAGRVTSGLLANDRGARGLALEARRRNGESILAMGMTNALAARWSALNDRYLTVSERLGDIVGDYGSLSRVLRILLQSMILGLGAYLVIHQELSAGAMIAASIMMSRALAPIETAIANWHGFLAARQSVGRLGAALDRAPMPAVATTLPAPSKRLDVDELVVAAPGRRSAIVSRVSFVLSAGEAVGVVGPSGSGKTSLARTLVGIWPAARGTVRLDGATLDQREPDALGRSVGYVSQGIELFDGTVAENIARMAIKPDSRAVIRAAQLAGAEEAILRLTDGYDTRIGPAGAVLSGGQKQRIVIARAFFGDPFLVVLDEPNSNLDSAGEVALIRAVLEAKKRGALIVLIAHRRSLIEVCDKVLVLADGEQKAFGPREEVLAKLFARRAVAPPAPLKVVGQAGSLGAS